MANTDKQVLPESPLSGVRVLELAQFIAGPYAGQQLADFGAEVIKIERPGAGDPFRLFVSSAKWDGYAHNFTAFNRNKLGLSLDIQRPEGKDVFRRLVAQSDVVLENFRPGVMDRLGIGYEALRQLNPAVIYCSISGFSEDGPYKDRPSFDSVGLALSGFMKLVTDPDNPKLRGPTVADQVTALQAAHAVAAALFGRTKTGKGSKIDVSMIESAIGFMPDTFDGYLNGGLDMQPETRCSYSQSFAFNCADGQLLAVHIGGADKFWIGLVTALGRNDLAEDSRFLSRMDRVNNFQDLIYALRPIFAAKPRGYWVQRLRERDVPSAEAHTVPEVLEDPEVKHLRLFEEAVHPKFGKMMRLRRPTRINGKREPNPLLPPLLGEHTDKVLRQFGYSDAEVAKLRENKIV